jgi:signal transduction histidine kinase
MKFRGSLIVAGAFLTLLPATCWAQRTWSWRTYSAADGLPESACLSVSTTPQGKVLARSLTQGAINELDGYTVNVLPAPGTGNNRVYESPGGQLWTVAPDGIEEFREGRWVLHPIPEIVEESRVATPHLPDPIPLCPVRQGQVIFLLTDRVMQYSGDDPDNPKAIVLLSAARTRLGKFTGMTASRDGGLWITGTHGILKIAGPLRGVKPEGEFQEYLPPASVPWDRLEAPHPDFADGVTAIAETGTNRHKVLVRFDGKGWHTEANLPPKVRNAWCGHDKNCWAFALDTLYELDRSRGGEFVENDELGARQYFDVAVEPGGNFWLATSDGLFRHSPLIWQTPAASAAPGASISFVGKDPDKLWFVSGNSVWVMPYDASSDRSLFSARLPGDSAARSVHSVKGGLLVDFGGEFAKLSVAGPELKVESLDNRAGHLRLVGALGDGRVCFQTFSDASDSVPYRLETYDGAEFQPLADAPEDFSLGTNLLSVFAAQNGDVWIGTESGTAVSHDRKWRAFATADRTAPQLPVGFVEFPDGKIWCATQDKIWEFDGRHWSAVRVGFDRVNAVLRSRDGSVWVASNGGLLRYFQGMWIENGLEEGLPALAVRQLCEDARGRLWAGTTHGLARYHPEADTDPPQSSIQELPQKDARISEGHVLSLSFGGQDKWKQTPRMRLVYSYRIDEREWSSFTPESMVSFSDLPAGKHYFQARAMDRNGNVDTRPARVEFAIILPWYKESRLVAIAAVGMLVALFFAGVAINRHRRLVRSYAEVERKVAERTRELEQANRALVHSQKMNALGTLAAGIAHDFNNILSIIKGSAQIIGDNLEDHAKISTRVGRINTAVEQGSGIVKAMLGFSRDSEQQEALTDLNAVVDETMKLLGDRFLREVQITFHPAPELPPAFCSPGFVQQILLNLIFNAAESMEKPKRVILTTTYQSSAPLHPVLAPLKGDGYAAISVRDFGCGIPSENLPRIFEPFFTTKAFSARRGTGLGLSMVYELAKKLGAGLTVESVIDHGSMFTLIVPLRPVASAATTETAPLATARQA